MSTTFGFDQYEDHDFYHARCGRGAIIIAVRRLEDKPFSTEQDRINSDKYIVKVFHEVIGQDTLGTSPIFNPVTSISEDAEFVRLTLEIEHRATIPPVVIYPIKARIHRVIPSRNVTFETVVENDSELLSASHLARGAKSA